MISILASVLVLGLLAPEEKPVTIHLADGTPVSGVIVDNGVAQQPAYVTDFDFGQPGFGQTNATYNLKQLLDHGGPPR